MGAIGAIDYTREDFRDGVRRMCAEGVDVVLDAVGGDTRQRSYDIMKKGARLISIVGEPDAADALAIAICHVQASRLPNLAKKRPARRGVRRR